MKFIASTSSLLKHLQLIDGVLSSNTVLPILENFLFDIQKGSLTVSSTDLETSMSVSLDIESKESGKIAIPGKLLLNTLKTLPEQPLTFTIDTQSFGIEILSDNGKYKLSGENGDDFPRIPVPEDIKDISIVSNVLKKAIGHSLFAVGTDELRPAMTGINVEVGNDGISFVATDAHKLVRYKHNETITSKSVSFIIPKKALTLLNNSLPADETPVKISYNNSNAFFRFNNVSMICRLIDARFPDYNAVIPTQNPNRLVISKSDLQNTLRRLTIFANKTTHQVSMRFKGSELHITARDLDFSNEANERLTCNYNGVDMEIAFNGRFLLDMLNATSSEEVQFEFSTPDRAALMTPMEREENEDLLMLVMPIMVAG